MIIKANLCDRTGIFFFLDTKDFRTLIFPETTIVQKFFSGGIVANLCVWVKTALFFHLATGKRNPPCVTPNMEMCYNSEILPVVFDSRCVFLFCVIRELQHDGRANGKNYIYSQKTHLAA